MIVQGINEMSQPGEGFRDDFLPWDFLSLGIQQLTFESCKSEQPASKIEKSSSDMNSFFLMISGL